MSVKTSNDIKNEFLKSKIGITGILILLVLITISIFAVVSTPSSTFQDWNNPEKWITYPKTSVPSWVNLFILEKIPEHKIFESENITAEHNNIFLTSQQFRFNYGFDDFPSDFMYDFTLEYSNSPLLEMIVIRPDGMSVKLLSSSLPHSNELIEYKQRIFSADNLLRKNIELQSDKYEFKINDLNLSDIIFSKKQKEVFLMVTMFLW